MDHLETTPDLYDGCATYAPVAGDFSDLAAVPSPLLRDEDLRRGLAQEAFARMRAYLEEARFVEEIGFLFEDEPAKIGGGPA
jgi:hypothetical protein